MTNDIKPQKEDLVKWVKALRSGEFLQAQGTMVDNDSYCCLGVLATILGAEIMENRNGEGVVVKEHLAIDGIEVDNMGIVLDGAGNNLLGGLPVDVIQVLVNMNDQDGESFDSIADYIEETLIK